MFVNLATPKVGFKHELLFRKPGSQTCFATYISWKIKKQCN